MEAGISLSSVRPLGILHVRFDADDDVVVVATTDPAATQPLADEVVAPVLARYGRSLTSLRIEVRTHSKTDLDGIAHDLVDMGGVADQAIHSVTVDTLSDRVIVEVEDPTDRVRAELASRFGIVVAVRTGDGSGHVLQSGPERYKDRYPYWGGQGYNQLNRTTILACTSAFSMRRGGSSPKHFTLTAGHCQHPSYGNVTTPTSQDGAGAWTNLLGTMTGYYNSFSAGGTEGDLLVWRNNGGQAVIWNGTAHTTVGSTVRSKFGGTLPVGTPLCVSGARHGAFCSPIANGLEYFYIGPGGSYGPLDGAQDWTDCTLPGDSGAPWFRQVSGGAQAIGVHSGLEQEEGPCIMVYTSIGIAETLYDAEILVNP